jgi:prephenate dehydrogenase
MKTQVITIIGLRRTGASIALSIKEGPLDVTVLGHDSDPALQKQAVELGAIDKVESNLIRAAAAADILVLAMPSVELEGTLRAIGEDLKEHTLIIDLTALKGPGIKLAEAYLRQGHYVGARPVFAAGTFADGLADAEKARADLFENSIFCLMPGARTDPQAVETAVNFGRLLGASPYFVDPLEYDNLAQGVETVPGLMAAALFRSVNKAAGWRDMLRFADLPFAMATSALEQEAEELAHLALNDKSATLRWLDAVMSEFKDLRRWIQEDNQEVLAALLLELRNDRSKWLQDRSKNDWLEGKDSAAEVPGLSQRLFGSLASRGGD